MFNALNRIIAPFLRRDNTSILLLVVFFSLWLKLGQLSSLLSIVIIFFAFAAVALRLVTNTLIFSSNKIASVLVFFYIYSIFLYLIYQPNNLDWSVLIAHLVCILLLVVSYDKEFIFNENKLFVTFFFTAAIATILNIIDGELILNSNNFSLKLAETSTSNSDGAYNKPLTRAYAMILIMLALSEKNSFIKIFGFIVFLYLMLMSGGRAEILLTFITLGLFKPKYLAGLAVSVLLLFFFTIDIEVLTENSIGLLRILDTLSSGEFSARIGLYLLSLETLNDNPRCLAFGCGITYFQAYNGLSSGLYPHNIILELLISFGLPFTLLAIFIFFVELRKNISKTQLALIIYLLGQMLLSGTLLSSYFLLLFLSLRPTFNGKS